MHPQDSTEHRTSMALSNQLVCMLIFGTISGRSTRGEGVPDVLEASQLSSIPHTGTEKGNVTVDSQDAIDVSTQVRVPKDLTGRCMIVYLCKCICVYTELPSLFVQ